MTMTFKWIKKIKLNHKWQLQWFTMCTTPPQWGLVFKNQNKKQQGGVVMLICGNDMSC
jgi:hypothetical protein